MHAICSTESLSTARVVANRRAEERCTHIPWADAQRPSDEDARDGR